MQSAKRVQQFVETLAVAVAATDHLVRGFSSSNLRRIASGTL